MDKKQQLKSQVMAEYLSTLQDAHKKWGYDTDILLNERIIVLMCCEQCNNADAFIKLLETWITERHSLIVYAEKGAVITKMDSKTGEFSWKGKCESCGTVSNTENGGSRLTTNGSSKNTSFVCQNPKCDLWGKGQPVVIGCDVTGEWIEVN